MDPLLITTRAELRDYVRGRDDDDLTTEARSIGIANILERVFEALPHEFNARYAPVDDVVLMWIVEDGQEEHLWRMYVSASHCAVAPVAATDPDVALTMSLATFLRVMAGITVGTKALGKGEIKLKGDLLLAASIEKWFPS